MESSEHSQLSDYPSDVEDEPSNVTDEDEQAGIDAPLPETFDLDQEENEDVSQPPATRQVEEGDEESEEPVKVDKRKRKSREYGIVEQDSRTGNWWWRKSKGSAWVPATLFTNEVRKGFLEKMRKLGQYAKPRPLGDGIYDETSFHPDQGSWGPAREDRPDILFQYERRQKTKKEKEAQKNPGFLYYRDRIVIAPDPVPHRPVLDFPEIPKTLSSAEQGWALEAMSRLNEFIRLEDFRDRMPPDHRPDINSLSMRRSRYRWNSGSLSWTQRDGSKAIKKYLDKIVPQRLLLANTTKGFRDLEEDEVEEMKAAGRGKHPERRRKSNKGDEVEEPPAKAGPSTKGKQKKKAKTRSRSPSRSRSPRSRPGVYRRRTPTPEPEETGKGKEAATESEGEDPQAYTFEQLEERYDWRDAVPQTHDELVIIHHALMTTRLQISSVTEEPTPRTDQHASYNEQWKVLHEYWDTWKLFNPEVTARFSAPVKHGPWFGDGFPREFLDYQGEHADIETGG